MAANYTKIDRTGSLDAGFIKFHFFKSSELDFHNIVMAHLKFKIREKAKKKFLTRAPQARHYTPLASSKMYKLTPV